MDSQHLPLASGPAFGVELAELQASEEQLDRDPRIAVRARVDDWNPKLLDYYFCLRASMVWCIIPKEYCIISPAW